MHLQANPTLSASSTHALPTDTSTVVVVTGAAGYVGGWLVRTLLQRGHVVRACVRDAKNDQKVGFLKAMPEIGSRLTLHPANMTVKGAYDEIFEGAHTVFHPAEVFMSFSTGSDLNQARKDFGEAVSLKAMNDQAVRSSQYIVDSINKSSTVRRLVYTASVASIMPTSQQEYAVHPGIDETREPSAAVVGQNSYAMTKRSTEHLFAYQASISAGKWSAIMANPSDIVGPVLSPHQARETWQGKIAGIIEGVPAPQEDGGRPWMLVDVRDVAEAEVRLAECPDVQSGERFMLTSGDKIWPEDAPKRWCATGPFGSGCTSATTRSPGQCECSSALLTRASAQPSSRWSSWATSGRR